VRISYYIDDEGTDDPGAARRDRAEEVRICCRSNYEKHLLKLQRIQAERRQNLTRNTLCEKTVLIEHIRNQRHVDFMAKLYRQEARIDLENSRLADKLNRTAGSLRDHRDAVARSSLTCALRHTRQKEISRENSRMFRKLVTS
jgi:hypothetical protein